MRQIDYGVMHCSGTPPSFDCTAKDVDNWHKQRGWKGIGYHYFIRRNGKVEKGRPEEEVGAHVYGNNSNSIGICYAGGVDEEGNPEDNRTIAQQVAIYKLLIYLVRKYPKIEILGHRDFPGVTKACPSYDVKKSLSWN